MSITQAYIDTAYELLGFVPELKIVRMFGGAGAKAGDMMFAVLDDDELWLKADAETIGLFEAEGLPQFVYGEKDGKPLTLGYWKAPAEVWDDEEAARHWVALAIDAALRAKAKRKPRKKKA